MVASGILVLDGKVPTEFVLMSMTPKANNRRALTNNNRSAGRYFVPFKVARSHFPSIHR